MTKKSLTLSLIACGIAACGGGGGGQEAPETTVIPAPPVADTPAQGAAGITVPDGFDFATSKDLRVLVTSEGDVAPRTYLTVCRSIATSDETDYERCLLRTPVIAGVLDHTVRLPNDVDQLTATLWNLQPAAPIRSVRWERSSDNPGALVIE